MCAPTGLTRTTNITIGRLTSFENAAQRGRVVLSHNAATPVKNECHAGNQGAEILEGLLILFQVRAADRYLNVFLFTEFEMDRRARTPEEKV